MSDGKQGSTKLAIPAEQWRSLLTDAIRVGRLSLAWFPWLLMGLWSRHPGPRGPLLVALGAFGIATAGWPHGLLVLGLVLASLLPWHVRDAESRQRLLWSAWVPATAGVLLAAPAWSVRSSRRCCAASVAAPA